TRSAPATTTKTWKRPSAAPPTSSAPNSTPGWRNSGATEPQVSIKPTPPSRVAAPRTQRAHGADGYCPLSPAPRKRLRPIDIHPQHPRHGLLAAVGGELYPQRQVVAHAR